MKTGEFLRFKITEYNLNIGKNLRLAFIADLHNFSTDAVLKAVKSEKVDAAILGGDILHGQKYTEQAFKFIADLSKIVPTFYALGNHEAGYSGDLRHQIASSGAKLLDNDYTLFKGINIGGLTSGAFYYSTKFKPNLNFLTEFSAVDGYKLLVCHHPEYYYKYIKDLNIDLTLSGHAHGGQWRIFGRGIYAPGQGILPKYTSGLYDGRLVVSRGLGNVYAIPKINNQPEILIINF